MTHSVTVPSNIRPDNEEIRERLLVLVQTSLRGDEVLLRVVMDGDPDITELDLEKGATKWEAHYSVAWQSESRRNKQITDTAVDTGQLPEQMRDCGTHIAMLNSDGVKALVWGHYDLDSETALRDCLDRARPAH